MRTASWEGFTPVDNMTIDPQIVWRKLPGALVLFDERTGRYHALNRVGSHIWRQLADGMTLPSIVEWLAIRFAEPNEIVSQSVLGFVAEATAKGLLIDSQGEEFACQV